MPAEGQNRVMSCGVCRYRLAMAVPAKYSPVSSPQRMMLVPLARMSGL